MRVYSLLLLAAALLAGAHALRDSSSGLASEGSTGVSVPPTQTESSAANVTDVRHKRKAHRPQDQLSPQAQAVDPEALDRLKQELDKRERNLQAREAALGRREAEQVPLPTPNLNRLRSEIEALHLQGPEIHQFSNTLRLLSHYASGLAIQGGARDEIGFKSVRLLNEPIHRRVAHSNCRGVDCFNAPVEELAQVLHDLLFVIEPALAKPEKRGDFLKMLAVINKDRGIALTDLEADINRLNNQVQMGADRQDDWRYAYGKGVLALRHGTRVISSGLLARLAQDVAKSSQASAEEKTFYQRVTKST